MAWFPADPDWTDFYLPPGTEQELEDLENVLRDIPQLSSQQHAMPSYPQCDLPTTDAAPPDPHPSSASSLIAPSPNHNPALCNPSATGRHNPVMPASPAVQPSEPLANPGATPKVRKARTPQKSLPPQDNSTTPLRCGWKDCTYNGTFGRKAELMRHIALLHVSPHSYDCPVPGCRKVCNRSDNLLDHIRRAH
ncbi:hypothetical protein ABOM_007910 [Aspergillus bombycis]|uniref:C2H2-type domain-containing protein n=1 Tax=Aspergillus bombycis TaxID=109264 RepID=A0A1F7ZT96_9EURO|nr:hypothetical protein ABOM_007910 [Aspergillus bombycis]OGM42308.1 hypothetical protein ABOM_007910 [Aspergillus bombycis]